MPGIAASLLRVRRTQSESLCQILHHAHYAWKMAITKSAKAHGTVSGSISMIHALVVPRRTPPAPERSTSTRKVAAREPFTRFYHVYGYALRDTCGGYLFLNLPRLLREWPPSLDARPLDCCVWRDPELPRIACSRRIVSSCGDNCTRVFDMPVALSRRRQSSESSSIATQRGVFESGYRTDVVKFVWILSRGGSRCPFSHLSLCFRNVAKASIPDKVVNERTEVVSPTVYRTI